MHKGYILLSFDVEEFDLPLEYQQTIPVSEQLETGYRGLRCMQELLDITNVKSTLYTTAFFAEHFPTDIRALSAKNEIASHAYSHSEFKQSDLLNSRKKLESITGKPIYGLRMPRMKPVCNKDVLNAGYLYNSSVNPTWLPGRYNNFFAKRTVFVENGLVIIPASVTPHIRLPLFWLTFKNIPYQFFLKKVIKTLKQDGYLNLYFHPWEFTDLSRYKLPICLKGAGHDTLRKKMIRLISDLSNEGVFIDTTGFLQRSGYLQPSTQLTV
ncbi:polysaccharide deacetylase [Terrimonas sp.]|uniref:DUF3473 domain-containing protein n=1 Tax=Terrimonas sp. TaxID=1914338 RepID=UPI000D5157D5|nr:DUF3473 domain-containing protein [Terrimonas sp.]PVD52976.1 polysaccharide deacetylase [Terrimonas sp.]